MLPVKVSANEREKGFVKRKMNKERYGIRFLYSAFATHDQAWQDTSGQADLSQWEWLLLSRTCLQEPCLRVIGHQSKDKRPDSF